jgi:small-conductance mechanosensitive channel
MLYEMLININWLLWFDRVLCSVAVTIFLFVVIWVLPIFVNYLLSISGVHATIRGGVIMLIRLVMTMAGIFIVGDLLGFASDVVFAVLGTVVGVGISWAIKDMVANTLAGFLVFIFQSYSVGDEISSRTTFKGIIKSFHMQYVMIQNEDTGNIAYIPNQLLWTTVIDIVYRKVDPEDICTGERYAISPILNV